MKIKKLNEISSVLSEEDIIKYRNDKFDNHMGYKKYHIYGERLPGGIFKDKYMTPRYIIIATEYDITDCIKYYNDNKERLDSDFDNLILIEDVTYSKILDFNLMINSNKYNL